MLFLEFQDKAELALGTVTDMKLEVLGEVGVTMVHLLRNALDILVHGILSPYVQQVCSHCLQPSYSVNVYQCFF